MHEVKENIPQSGKRGEGGNITTRGATAIIRCEDEKGCGHQTNPLYTTPHIPPKKNFHHDSERHKPQQRLQECCARGGVIHRHRCSNAESR
ncbi:hypothetical protein E2C01_073326 [Portunus trituberculatus]|uniref:Uncharacterized protein n=1 Tax=Portunus trituberculatus TaxID=210409 RepID=A0A5B7ID97_PORTR|nr:hypothetical protein [Portunus trituberculatus]